MGTPASVKNARVMSTDRKPGYYESRRGRRFIVTHQTMTSTILGQTSWVDTTPTFLIYQSAGSKRYILSDFSLSQSGTVAGAVIHVAIFVDPTSRYASGGTEVVEQNAFADRSTDSISIADRTAGFTFMTLPTASAVAVAPNASRCIYHGIFAPNSSAPSPISLDSEDVIMLGKTGSILVYTWAGTTGPTWGAFSFDLIEE